MAQAKGRKYAAGETVLVGSGSSSGVADEETRAAESTLHHRTQRLLMQEPEMIRGTVGQLSVSLKEPEQQAALSRSDSSSSRAPPVSETAADDGLSAARDPASLPTPSSLQAKAYEARIVPISLELVLKVRRSRFEQCLKGIGSEVKSFADVVNENWNSDDGVTAYNAERPADGGNMYLWIIMRKIIFRGGLETIEEEKARIREQVQKIMNSMCGRRNIGQVIPDEEAYGLKRAVPMPETEPAWQAQWDSALRLHLQS